jgi:hypothetical protein
VCVCDPSRAALVGWAQAPRRLVARRRLRGGPAHARASRGDVAQRQARALADRVAAMQLSPPGARE